MRIVLVSNRLPITLVENNGEIKFKESTGGLVSGLCSYLQSSEDSCFTEAEHIWLGWPGIVIDDKSKEEFIL